APGGGAAMHAGRLLQVFTEGQREDEEGIGAVDELGSDDLVGLVDLRADVHVLMIVVSPAQLGGDLAQAVDAIRQGGPQDASAAVEPLEVIVQPEDVHAPAAIVPVAPDALERSGPVQERVRHDADLAFAKGPEAAVEVGNSRG